MVALILALASPASGNELPEPPSDRWAETSLALLQYNREMCDGIAGKVLVHWRGLTSSPEAQIAAVRQYVVDRDLSNLASARSASDVVESFLPRLREKVGNEIGGALERLHRLQVELCDTVAYPIGTRPEFESRIRQFLDRIEREESELGRLVVVSEEALDEALGPYLGHIQFAGVEAEGEYRDYLDSLKPPPVEPTVQERMESWHRRYSAAVRPTKQALGRYLQGRQANDSKLLRTACKEVSAAVIPLLQNKAVFQAPVPSLRRPLAQAFSQIRQLATACAAGRSREMEEHYREMQKELRKAAGVMSEFSLSP